MKEFFRWFKSGAKMKRWLFLMLIGIVLLCYAMAKILVTKEFDFSQLASVVILFVLGFTFTIISIICIQKRTLELLVEESDTRDIKKGNAINSLIFNKKIYNQGPKIVVIGGGNGLNSVLRGLKNYTDNITAIVTISTYGKEATLSEKELNVQALEDIKSSIIALSTNEDKMKYVFAHNINIPKLSGLNFGDIYLRTMEEEVGDFTSSIEESSSILSMTGKVLPVTLDSIKICAELDDGTVVESKDKIPEMVNEKISKINRIYVSPTNSRVAPGVIEAIKEADAVVIGPGSLYTNVIPNLLIPGVSKAIRESKGIKIYVSNIMTEQGQTDGYSLSRHTKAILDHAGQGIIDYCIYDTGEIIPEYIKKYNNEGSELVEQDVVNVKSQGIKLIQRNLSTIENEKIQHNSDAIATTIIQLICDDLKFNDMQNDAKYMMLESRVKDTNKRLREKTKENRKNINKKRKEKSSDGKSSKFFEKYNERIESIKESGSNELVKIEKNRKEEFKNKITKPVEEAEKSVEQIEKPIKEIERPVEQIEKPIKEVERPVEQIEKPIEEIAKPVEQIENKELIPHKNEKTTNNKKKNSRSRSKKEELDLKSDKSFMDIINNMRR